MQASKQASGTSRAMRNFRFFIGVLFVVVVSAGQWIMIDFVMGQALLPA